MDSCFHGQLEHFSSDFLQGQNSFYKCCIGVVWAFHGHIQCVFLMKCVGRKKSHTNHIGSFSCFHESFGNVFSDLIQGQNIYHKCCIDVVSGFYEHTQCVFLDNDLESWILT